MINLAEIAISYTPKTPEKRFLNIPIKDIGKLPGFLRLE
jgi:hypothetical protein